MNKFVALLAGLTAAAASVPAVAVTTVSFNGGSGVLPANAAVIQDFESFAAGTPGAAIGPNAYVYSGSVGSQSARPAFGSTGNFATVLTGGSYSIDFAPTKAFSFVLGSLDTYNTLTLKYENGSSQAYIGGQIINDLTFPSGNQISGETNGVVTYSVASGPRIVGAVFQSSQNSFEVDNLAVAAVPEPAAWALMIGGFGLVGAVSRRRKRQPVAFA
ncbi:PEPxxWA-CTERM sorting domain-containing protein [Sphingomonas sp. MAH-20]|uniref:PEPxxWA-CTERM sorting domain-containing protein n=1 Tax=Sphingomonas horti TaxID=2682842 RepID=A0A6I4IW89_9SPHN|nr:MULTISPECIES: PEPxxWA-CTERM sorting domain-containing protein [Sphingomonas]MBA2920079.1 PEPxxWA-CTERM sorting domain-containing protein [Sphingomonas sp. CGMCC 1.13658]MVO76334.1 PEPxxWA-CTERM sorting domain-containing protein [Sphingomonas horti]